MARVQGFVYHDLNNKETNMQSDPFGNLKEWGPVLESVCQLADEGKLSECQPGLVRILAYPDNWRLREETLRRIGAIANPDDALVRQVLSIIANDNLYFEVKILACDAMAELLKKQHHPFMEATRGMITQILDNQIATPQPPIFEQALRKLYLIARERFDNR
jgi:hypothetical protein